MFRFWYRFVFPNSGRIEQGAGQVVYRRIEPQLPHFMGPVFEQICQEYLWKLFLNGESPVEFMSLGRWWGADPSTRSQAEIDIVGADEEGRALLAECKWTNAKVDRDILDTLMRRGSLIPYEPSHFFLFSKSGFTKGCKEQARTMGNVSLLSYGDMLRVFEPA